MINVSEKVLYNPNLTPTERITYIALMSEKDKSNFGFKFREKIAAKIGLTERTIRRVCNDFEKQGILRINKSTYPTSYDICDIDEKSCEFKVFKNT